MSENENFNDDMAFQSFSKDFAFKSNKDINKSSQNEIIEFTFKKNLYLPKSDDNNNHSKISSFNEMGSNIYSQNDQNIQVSGHFGKSKYDSKNYKKIIEKNNLIKQPLFYIEENYNLDKEKEQKLKSLNNLQNNNNNLNIFNNKIKKIQIIRKKKSFKKNNSSSFNYVKKVKADSFSSFRNNNKNGEQVYLYKKKLIGSNNFKNSIDISNKNKFINNTYEGRERYTYNRNNNPINIKELKYNNKYEIIKICKNLNQNKKKTYERNHNINKLSRIGNNDFNFNYTIKNLYDNKENIDNNNKSQSFINCENDNLFSYNKYNLDFNKYNSINSEPDNPYINISSEYQYFNKLNKNENFESLKNDYKTKNIKKKNLISTPSLIRNNNAKKVDKNKNYLDNENSNRINGHYFEILKAGTHKCKLGKKKVKKISSKKLKSKKTTLREKILPFYFENHGINF